MTAKKNKKEGEKEREKDREGEPRGQPGKWRRGGVHLEGGGGEAIEEGEGEVVEANRPPKMTLFQWFLKALGPSSFVARKAAVIPSHAQAL